MALFKQLLSTSKLSAANFALLREKDVLTIVDMHVHSGDHAMATIMLQAEKSSHQFMHVLVEMANKTGLAAVAWTTQRASAASSHRVSCVASSDLLGNELRLGSVPGSAMAETRTGVEE